MYQYKNAVWSIYLSIDIVERIFKITNSNGPDFDQFWSKPYKSAKDRPKIRGNFFCQIFVKIVELMDKTHEILHRGPALQKTSKQRSCHWPIPWCKYLFIHKKQIKIKSKLKVKSKYLDLKLQWRELYLLYGRVQYKHVWKQIHIRIVEITE